jgi:ABC-2 type transport system ATP-binding protein
MNVIEVKGLSKTFKVKTKEAGLRGSISTLFRPDYKTVEAVKGIDFTVSKGEILAFIGPNGAGKSTTIKMLTGILHPTSGYMSVLGLDPGKQRKKLSYKIGSVFGQKSQLWFHLPPLDTFKLLGVIYELPEAKLKKRIDYLVELFEIEDLMNIPVRKLSLGQRIRCEIAASLLHEPEVIFLDEPTIGLDIIVKKKIRDLIKKLAGEEETTIFLTSHDIGDIEQICRRAIIINHGEIVLDESIKNLKYNYLHKKVIDVRFNDITTVRIPDVEVLKQADYSAKIQVDTRKCNLHDVMEQLMKSGN